MIFSGRTPVGCQARCLLFGLSMLVLTAFAVSCRKTPTASPSAIADDEFTKTMNVGKNYYDKGEADKAVQAFQKGVSLSPTHPDAHLNLANAFLLAGQETNAVREAREVLNLDASSAAAHYVLGCAYLRLNQFEPAVQELQKSTEADPSVAAAFFQLGVAHQQLKHSDEAISAFQAAIALEPNHPAAHYNLSQALVRAGQTDAANKELATHQQIVANAGNQSATPATYERCKHTEARVPVQLEQPALVGIKVTFADAGQRAFSGAGGIQRFRGPVGVLDVGHDGFQDLFLREGAAGFRLLINSNGFFFPFGDVLTNLPGARYTRCLVGDLQNDINNDRTEDVIVLGPQGSHVFKFSTNAVIRDMTQFSRLGGLAATDGALVDLDFTGKLDLVAITATNDVRVFRNLGGLYFKETTLTSGVPASVTTAQKIVVDDWNNDDLMDVVLSRAEGPPLLLLKQRGGPLMATNMNDWPAGTAVAIGDLNNDLRADLVVATRDHLEIILNGFSEHVNIPLGAGAIKTLALIDYDNDGWLDIFGAGAGLHVWRNRGRAGFAEVTQEVGLGQITGEIEAVSAADFDHDGDTDLLLTTASQELRLLRNDGGNANLQLKMRLLGNRSNPSGIGVRIEVAAGGLRLIRTVGQLPIEIGVGQHKELNSVAARWFNLEQNNADVTVDPKNEFALFEITLPTGSCPYLYAWNGERFKFVTDLLGASPLGLPAVEGRYIEANPVEYIWLGDETTIKPQGEDYVLQITEELQEILYLDAVKLWVVDHPPGTEVYPTTKLVPGKPFPTNGTNDTVTLYRKQPLIQAMRDDGTDVTDFLRRTDGEMVSPLQLRAPQLRGLAEPYGIILDFGPLNPERPLMLALTGWLHFGGGMVNVAASQHPDLPFPFPKLEVETTLGKWQPVDVVVGTPAGKTKRMVVDLTGKLPRDGQRLRLSTAFEIHWDQISLFERADPPPGRAYELEPSSADLHWRGFSEYQDLPADQPLTPRYDRAKQNPHWRTAPQGWVTRYGDVRELLLQNTNQPAVQGDNRLVMMAGGDELTVKFAVSEIPKHIPGFVRDFFLVTVGWDKDTDFHVAHGATVEPLPFHGMNDQLYGRQPRPKSDGDAWIEKYNTRWVGPTVLKRPELTARQSPSRTVLKR